MRLMKECSTCLDYSSLDLKGKVCVEFWEAL